MSANKTNEQYCQEVLEIHGDQITVIGRYINHYTKIQHKCNKCESIWECPHIILHGKGCQEQCYTGRPIAYIPERHGKWGTSVYRLWEARVQSPHGCGEDWQTFTNFLRD